MTTILAKDLPYEVYETIKTIRKGGPYVYPKDGTEFKNHEKLLPIKESGYYREFTASTSNAANRGARRIVVGKNSETYYTDDHYQTFKEVKQ